jgi:hypothetical protein
MAASPPTCEQSWSLTARPVQDSEFLKFVDSLGIYYEVAAGNGVIPNALSHAVRNESSRKGTPVPPGTLALSFFYRPLEDPLREAYVAFDHAQEKRRVVEELQRRLDDASAKQANAQVLQGELERRRSSYEASLRAIHEANATRAGRAAKLLRDAEGVHRAAELVSGALNRIVAESEDAWGALSHGSPDAASRAEGGDRPGSAEVRSSSFSAEQVLTGPAAGLSAVGADLRNDAAEAEETLAQLATLRKTGEELHLKKMANEQELRESKAAIDETSTRLTPEKETLTRLSKAEDDARNVVRRMVPPIQLVDAIDKSFPAVKPPPRIPFPRVFSEQKTQALLGYTRAMTPPENGFVVYLFTIPGCTACQRVATDLRRLRTAYADLKIQTIYYLIDHARPTDEDELDADHYRELGPVLFDGYGTGGLWKQLWGSEVTAPNTVLVFGPHGPASFSNTNDAVPFFARIIREYVSACTVCHGTGAACIPPEPDKLPWDTQ